MSAHMKKHRTDQDAGFIQMHHGGIVYQFPRKVAEKYRLTGQHVSPADIFSRINKKYTKPGALLKGIRVRENLTQVEMAKRLHMTQSDISQMEHGTRQIGRKIAQRIEALFGVNYRLFLA